MSKGDVFENDFLKLIFNGTSIANIADNAGTSPLSNLYVSLHTSDPGESGNQESNETSYTSYERVAVARSDQGWTVTDNSVSPAADIDFPACTGGTATVTHFAVGTASSGGGKILYKGALSPNISVSTGVTPKVDQSTTITED